MLWIYNTLSKHSKAPIFHMCYGFITPSKHTQKLRIGGPGAAHVEMLEREVRTLHIVQPDPPSQSQSWTEAQVMALQSLVCFSSSGPAKDWPLSRRTTSPSNASTVRKVPFCTLPPAPMRRSLCGAFVGTAPRASSSTSKASGGASLRFSRSLMWSRLAREMTRLTSGFPHSGSAAGPLRVAGPAPAHRLAARSRTRRSGCRSASAARARGTSRTRYRC